MKVQWMIPAVALWVAATPLVAQQEPGSQARRQRIEMALPRMTFQADSFMYIVGSRPRLGVSVDLTPNESDSIGARIMSVTPGGPAAKAGIRTGDVITRLDGQSLMAAVSRESPARDGQSLPGLRLIELAAKLRPNDTVAVELRRGKDRRTVRVITLDDAAGYGFNRIAPGQMWKRDSDFVMYRSAPKIAGQLELERMLPLMETRLDAVMNSRLGSLELAPLNADLGSYFGATDGVLVISAPRDSKLGLKGGDVVLSVDGRKPTGPSHLMRILQSYDNRESFRIEVMRNHRRDTVTGRLAE